MTEKRIHRIIMETINDILREEVNSDSIYSELDYQVEMICYQHGFNVHTKEENDGTYVVFFQADERNEKVKEAIEMLKQLGLKYESSIVPTIHMFKINFK